MRVNGRPVCERLEGRQLLTTYSYVMPTGHHVAYLQPDTSTPGRVLVRFDDPVSGAIGRTFTNVSGMDVITNPIANFTFIDQVPAADKPSSDASGDRGIKVQGGAGGTLEIDAGLDDRFVQAFYGTSPLGQTIQTVDRMTGVAGSIMSGAGVHALTIRTNDVAASNFADGTRVYIPYLNGGGITQLTIDTGAGTYDRIDLGDNNSIVPQTVVKTGAGHDVVNVQLTDSHTGTNAVVDFVYANRLGLGNVLNVHSSGIAHLDNAPGTPDHMLFVDEINLSGGAPAWEGDAVVDNPATIGTINVASYGQAILSAPSTVSSFNVAAGGFAAVEFPSTIGTFDIDGGADFTGTCAGTTVDTFSSSMGTVSLYRAADVTVLHTSTIGTLWFYFDAYLHLASHAGSIPEVLTVDSLNYYATGGLVDLNNNAMILDYTGTSPLTSVQALIDNGYNGEPFITNRIYSSWAAQLVASDHKTALGFAEAADAGIDSFCGQPVDDTAVVVRYTWFGDANLDGAVSLADFTILAAHFGGTNETWLHGDFSYDAAVDAADFTLLATNFNQTAAGLTVLPDRHAAGIVAAALDLVEL